MKPFLSLLALVCLAACPSSSLSAQEEKKPPTLAEAKAAYARADKALNTTWAETRKVVPEWEFGDLQQDQRNWLEYRDRRVKEAMAFDHRDVAQGKEKESPHYWEWLKELTETRTVILKAWRNELDDKPWTGRYIDGHGGILEIVEKDKQLFFTLEVVRGPTYHLGSIAGTAKRNRQMGRFSDETVADEDKLKNNGETWLSFQAGRRWLTITSANTQYYHGARAYFDGRYFRIATLDEKEQAKVVQAGTNPEEWDER